MIYVYLGAGELLLFSFVLLVRFLTFFYCLSLSNFFFVSLVQCLFCRALQRKGKRSKRSMKKSIVDIVHSHNLLSISLSLFFAFASCLSLYLPLPKHKQEQNIFLSFLCFSFSPYVWFVGRHVCCVTSDFSMQNVLLQMGLEV